MLILSCYVKASTSVPEKEETFLEVKLTSYVRTVLSSISNISSATSGLTSTAALPSLSIISMMSSQSKEKNIMELLLNKFSLRTYEKPLTAILDKFQLSVKATLVNDQE